MQSDAKTVTEYLQEVPEARREALTKLRALCLEALPGYEEVMDYGMPGYTRNGVDGVGFASQKNYISLYILNQDVLDANRDALQGLSVGKCCIRYSNPKKMDFAVIRKLLEETAASSSEPC
jgi:uncharacterized protein YdhG (YjbR/CyaY superfamily)